MISVLYVRRDSVYKELGVDCWDIDRDARTWPGGNAIVGHPPCRAWGRLSHFAKPRKDEKKLAIDCVKKIRKWGGVLEHPKASRLFEKMSMPLPGTVDKWGGTPCLLIKVGGDTRPKRQRFFTLLESIKTSFRRFL